jgi:adenine deaminase
VINNFSCSKKSTRDFEVPADPIATDALPAFPAIEALDGQLITNKVRWTPLINNNLVTSDPEKDIIKIVVVNRYNDAPIAKAFIKNFGLKSGALASSVGA